MSATHWDHVLAALLGLVLPGLGAFRHFRDHQSSGADSASTVESWDSSQKIAMYWTNAAFLALASGAVLWAWLGAGRSMAELGFAAPERVAEGLGLGLLLAALYAADAVAQIAPSRLERTRERWRTQTPFMPVDRWEQAHSLAMVLSAAVCEEVLYRGFLIQYMQTFTGDSTAGRSLAILIPALVFAVLHYYQGTAAVAKVAVLATILGAIFAITGSLWIPIALHFAMNFCGILLGPRLGYLPRTGSEPEPSRLQPGDGHA